MSRELDCMRIVSLVPSITETLFALGLDSKQIVGRTPWCIHPAKGVESIEVVGGTKTPNINKIGRLSPDLIILDKEENPKQFYDELIERGYKTFVSTIHSPTEVPEFLRKLGVATGRKQNGESLALECEMAINDCKNTSAKLNVLPMIWHEPLMAVSPRRYAGALLELVGFKVPGIEPNGNGYPVVKNSHVLEHEVDGLLLSSEPHEFAEKEGQALIAEIFSTTGIKIWYEMIDGENLTWFGSRTSFAIRELKTYCDELKDKHALA